MKTKTIITTTIAILFTGCSGCHHRTAIQKQVGDCDESDGAYTLALRSLHRVLGSGVDKYDIAGGAHNKLYWQPIINTQRKEIANLRAWANGLKEKNAKRGYLNWLRYYDDQLDDAQKELNSGPRRPGPSDEDILREQNVQCYLQSHPFPTPKP